MRLAEIAGLELMPWQRFVLEQALRQHPDGRWAAFEVLLLVPRQNGKNVCAEAAELHALFQMGMNVYHTAHVMKTVRKSHKRLWGLIESTPQLLRRVAWTRQTAEEISFGLTNGAHITFMARGQRAGRGLDDCDLLILDEALFLEERTTDAIVPTMSTRENPQVWYTSSAGVVGSALLRKLRQRMVDRAPGFAGSEWSVPPPTKDRPFDPMDVDALAQANPSLGALISLDYVRSEQQVLGTAGFARERGGIFDEDPAESKRVIPAVSWAARAGATDRPDGPVAFGVASAWPDASHTAIAVVGRRGEELVAQVVEYRPGTSWRLSRIRELAERHNAPVVIDPGGPAGDLVADIEAENEAGELQEIVLLTPTMRQVGHSAKDLLAEIDGDTPRLRHFGQRELDDAAAAAGRRTLGDLWTFSRRGEVDISPLEAVQLGVWGVNNHEPYEPPAPVAVGASSSSAQPETADVSRIGF